MGENTGGTHMGRLDPAARERRRAKNLRNASRRNLDMHASGSSKVVTKRLYKEGNRQVRGVGR